MARILSGKEVSERLQGEISSRIAGLDVVPKLATVRVGEQGADVAYEANATKKLRGMGLEVENVVLSGDSEQDLMTQVGELGERADIHGILVFQPLPEGWNTDLLRTTLNPEKDIDCSTWENLGKLLAGAPRFVPGAPGAVMELLSHYAVDLVGKEVAVIGRSTVVGRPLAQLLTSAGATVTVCHSKSKNLAEVCRSAEILVTSAGVANLVTGEFVHDKQIVVDVSTNVVDGKLCGDICLETVSEKAESYTPTPGGIGAICTTVLAKQVVKACENLTGKG